MTLVECPDCRRGVSCPDWDADNSCSAGIPKTLMDGLGEVFDAIELAHTGSIYDTGDYREVTDEISGKLRAELYKLKAIKKLKREGLNNWKAKGDYYWLKISEILEAS